MSSLMPWRSVKECRGEERRGRIEEVEGRGTEERRGREKAKQKEGSSKE